MENADKGSQCIDCNKCYKRKSDLNRHVRSKKKKILFALFVIIISTERIILKPTFDVFMGMHLVTRSVVILKL